MSLLRGAAAIAEHLGMTPKEVEHMHRQRLLPTFRLPGDSAPHATVGALREWREFG
jgi:hypothetical protein